MSDGGMKQAAGNKNKALSEGCEYAPPKKTAANRSETNSWPKKGTSQVVVKLSLPCNQSSIHATGQVSAHERGKQR